MENPDKLTKIQKKELRKQEWQEKAQKEQRNAQVKKYSVWVGAVAFIGLTILGLIWLVSTPPSSKVAVEVASINPKDITKGNPKAKVTLIEYADFQCPACSMYAPLVNQLLTEYKDRIHYAFRIFPLTNAHQNALISGQAAYAAHKQGKFFEMSDMIFEKQADWSNLSDPTGTFMDYARDLKLDAGRFQKDMNSDETKKYVKDSENLAISEGINSTPTFILNGSKISNPTSYEDFKKVIDEELNKE